MKKTIVNILTLLGFLTLLLGISFFLAINHGVFFSTIGVGVILFVGLLLPLVVALIVAKIKKINLFRGEEANNKTMVIAFVVVSMVALGMFLYILLNGIIIDYFQPLSLSILTTILLIAGVVVIFVSMILDVILNRRYAYAITVVVCLLSLMFSGVYWANSQGYGDFKNSSLQTFLFNNGEGGYATFRIPSIIALDKTALGLHTGIEFDNDVLLATAEGRVNSSHDKGDIDIVGKISLDGGQHWSNLHTLFVYPNEIGKIGNPTPVFDKITGKINFLHMQASQASDFHYKTYNVQGELKLKSENLDKNNPNSYEIVWGEYIHIDLGKHDSQAGGADGVRADTLMMGPGKGIQLEYNTDGKNGRLIAPGSNDGYSFALYSDDSGSTWVQSSPAGSGNECELVELDDGTLVMVLRENIGCSNFHSDKVQRLSYSYDGGETWSEVFETPLKSPICMSSIDKIEGNKIVLSYPNSHLTRTNLTVALSVDNGKTFGTKLIYGGASGYSCIVVDSDGNLFILAEIGKVNYNEQLFFAKITI